MEIKKMNTAFLLGLKTSLSEVLGNVVSPDRNKKSENGSHENRDNLQKTDINSNLLDDFINVQGTVSASIDSLLDSERRSSEMLCMSNLHNSPDLNSQNDGCGNCQESNISCNLVFTHTASGNTLSDTS